MSRPRKNKNDDTEKYRVEVALYGCTSDNNWDAWGARYDEDARHRFWAENRERLLKMWNETHKDGTMPHDFHRYEK